ncbi:MAG: class C sortase, partial [Lachnospiraceae bacterium]
MKNKKRFRLPDKLVNFLMILLLVSGLALLIYPTFANWWNQQQQDGAIVRYTRMVETKEPEEVIRMRKEAREYNQTHGVSPAVELKGAAREEYDSVLDVSGTGIMGYINIPKIDVSLPIYHGTSEAVLQVAVGHLEGTSLPVGGSGTHCVLTGHTGLPSAELFTRVDELVIGDTFSMEVLGETLIYEVDNIESVLPSVLTDLAAVEGEDLCTLITCTPYGINTHRLLVRGHRVIPPDEPVIEDPQKAEEREMLIQQLRLSDGLFVRDGLFQKLAAGAVAMLAIGAFAALVHFLKRK